MQHILNICNESGITVAVIFKFDSPVIWV